MLSLIRSGNLAAAERFWAGMNKISGKTPPLVQAAIIEGYAFLKRFDRALAAWKVFTVPRETPTVAVHQAYINALLRQGRPDDALAELGRLEQNLCERSNTSSDSAVLSAFNTVLEWLLGRSRFEEARAILGRMKKTGPKPDAASFNVFMKHHSRSKDLSAISGIMQEMRSSGIDADIYTASILLLALHSAREDAPQLAITLLRQSGITADTTTCTTLLEHLVRSEDDNAFDAALAFVEHMETRNLQLPSSDQWYMLTTVLCGIERRVWRSSPLAARYRHVVIGKMEKHQRSPFRPTSHTLIVIQACCENPTPEAMQRAMVYYRMHKREEAKRGNTANWRVWSKLMEQLIRRGEWKLADELADNVDVKQFSPGMRQLLNRAKSRDNSDYVHMNPGVKKSRT
ncbi:uncharacterized protein PHACADRAFT_266446 [Phanerochaete carnosa HHB-10118-sp]|uniref:Pentacotripeptide-repeat region of PRORP domain-containing protein n=1 Tax=Phanerochaete carnosa (strain HHB-10118-sp) TaxID=650164 RepID=K5VP13_PHACS|nr:uncharacterized protein PHACADRAFT_266446 [Phanerochaete carnosa HHB-10118-sp]EKM48289.1 hypothetical protein PHACADRAFT_266446 [Phanerochaete carnosa HHB-10118-sp]